MLSFLRRKIEKLSKMFSSETDNEKRRELTKEITELLAEKRRLSK